MDFSCNRIGAPKPANGGIVDPRLRMSTCELGRRGGWRPAIAIGVMQHPSGIGHSNVSIGNIMKHPFSPTIFALLALLGAAACDSGSVHPALLHTAVLEQSSATPAPPRDAPPPAYFGDEYADVQRALPDRRDPLAPTF